MPAANSVPALVVGLGNPGSEYARTRHNVGFLVVDRISELLGISSWRTQLGADVVSSPTERLVLMKPLSYMNESGRPVQVVAHFYRISPSQMLVVSDDLDLPFGRLRLRLAGGHGGHNGLRSIIGVCGENFARLRVGIGRDAHAATATARVLGPFHETERSALPAIIEAAALGVLRWHRDGGEAAMRDVNAVIPFG